jgi:hypothetical protein
MARSRGSLSGLALILLGAWGGLAPLIGPYFHFGFLPDKPWYYDTSRLYLALIPGGVVLVAGLVVLLTRHRGFGGVFAFIAAVGGAWFVVGQTALQIITGTIYGDGTPVATGTKILLLTDLACFAGVGVLIVFFAALALGRQSIAAHKDHLKFGDTGALATGSLANVGLTPSAPTYDPNYDPYQPTAYQQPAAYDTTAAQPVPGDDFNAAATNAQPVVGGQAQFPSQYPQSSDPSGPDQYGASTNSYSPGGAITYSPGQTQYPPAQGAAPFPSAPFPSTQFPSPEFPAAQEQTNTFSGPGHDQQFPPGQHS